MTEKYENNLFFPWMHRLDSNMYLYEHKVFF